MFTWVTLKGLKPMKESVVRNAVCQQSLHAASAGPLSFMFEMSAGLFSLERS